MRTSPVIVLLLVIALALTGCNSSSPVAPSPLPPPVARPAPEGNRVRGSVSDTAFRPLAGVRVEVISGPGAGRWTTTDASGVFMFSEAFDDQTQFRASKDGYLDGIRTRGTRYANSPYWWIYFPLAPLGPSANIAGNYSLTLTAASTCTDLPADMRTRTYSATIAPQSGPDIPVNTLFTARVGGGSFHAGHGSFPIGVAGDHLTIVLGDHGPYLVEEVATNTYLWFDAWVQTSVGTAPVSTIATSFEGWIGYCELKSPMGAYFDCSPAPAVARAQCFSSSHRMTLTRR